MLRVKDLMTTRLDAVPPETSLHEALSIMNRDGCRQMPVVDGGRLVGIITDRDVRLAVNSPVLEEDLGLAREDVLDGLTVARCMTPDPVTVTSDTSAYEVADLLCLRKFGALPVVDDGELVGIVTVIDYLRHFAAQAERGAD